jgi:predicted lipoprotein with Yx(FWY)xxD motif
LSTRRIALASATAAVGLGSLVLQAAASATAQPTRAAASRPAVAGIASGGARINLRRTSLGMLLVNSRGFVVYAFSRDSRNRDRCITIKHCTGTWPLVKTSGRPIAGPGVKRSLLGTIKVNGVVQVTYAGHPLYTYTAAAGPGSTSYVGFPQFTGVWLGLRASGATVR